MEYTEKVGEIAKRHGVKLHIDGARLFNASIVISVTYFFPIYNQQDS